MTKRHLDDEKVGGTLQTVAKMTPDPLYQLAKGGFLSALDLQCADCIVNGYNSVLNGTGLRMMPWEPWGHVWDPWHTANDDHDPDGNHFHKWSAEYENRGYLLSPIIEIIVSRYDLNRVEARFDIKKNQLKHNLRFGLELYGEMRFGWQKNTCIK